MDCGKRQTSTATPAKPGDLPYGLANAEQYAKTRKITKKSIKVYHSIVAAPAVYEKVLPIARMAVEPDARSGIIHIRENARVIKEENERQITLEMGKDAGYAYD